MIQKKGDSIFAHSRARYLSGPPRLLPLYILLNYQTIGKKIRSNTVPSLLIIILM